MALPKVELLLAYVLADPQGYTSVCITRRDDEDILVVYALGQEQPPIDRRTMLEQIVKAVRAHRPDRIFVQVGAGQQHEISFETTKAIAEGRFSAEDLLVGA
jgi:hypothetical protein